MTKSTISDLRASIVEAVSILDDSDGSRTSLTQAIDDARSVLQTTYGDTLDEDVLEFAEDSSDDESNLEEIDEDE